MTKTPTLKDQVDNLAKSLQTLASDATRHLNTQASIVDKVARKVTSLEQDRMRASMRGVNTRDRLMALEALVKPIQAQMGSGNCTLKDRFERLEQRLSGHDLHKLARRVGRISDLLNLDNPFLGDPIKILHEDIDCLRNELQQAENAKLKNRIRRAWRIFRGKYV